MRNQDERARGVATFRKQWELDADDSPVWRELATALELGRAYLQRDKARASSARLMCSESGRPMSSL